MGNFSRDSFDALKHYVGVRLQQGVPLVDADWNELDDIRRFELRSFIRWFVGNGVPPGNDGFLIEQVSPVSIDFLIGGGDGTAVGAGRCLVAGLEARNEYPIRYSEQPLFLDSSLAGAWGVASLPALTDPGADERHDLVYLDVWEREVTAEEDPTLVDSRIGVETCVRVKLEWVVRVAEGEAGMSLVPQLPEASAETVNHAYTGLAVIHWLGGEASITSEMIEDRRRTRLSVVDPKDVQQMTLDAFGEEYSLGQTGEPELPVDLKTIARNVIDGELCTTQLVPITDNGKRNWMPFPVRAFDETVWVFWFSDQSSEDGEYNVWGRRYNLDSESWGAPIQVSESLGTEYWSWNIVAAPTPNGDMFVFWYHDNPAATAGVSYRQYDSAAGLWQAEGHLDQVEVAASSRSLRVASDPATDDLWLFWQYDSANGARVSSMRRDGLTGAWDEGIDVNGEAEGERDPAPVFDSYGRLWVCWVSETTDPPGLFVKRYLGTAWEASATQVPTDAENIHEVQAVVLGSAASHTYIEVAWRADVDDGRRGTIECQAGQYLANATTLSFSAGKAATLQPRTASGLSRFHLVNRGYRKFASWERMEGIHSSEVGRFALHTWGPGGKVSGSKTRAVFNSNGEVWIFAEYSPAGASSTEICYRKLLASMTW